MELEAGEHLGGCKSSEVSKFQVSANLDSLGGHVDAEFLLPVREYCAVVIVSDGLTDMEHHNVSSSMLALRSRDSQSVSQSSNRGFTPGRAKEPK